MTGGDAVSMARPFLVATHAPTAAAVGVPHRIGAGRPGFPALRAKAYNPPTFRERSTQALALSGRPIPSSLFEERSIIGGRRLAAPG